MRSTLIMVGGFLGAGKTSLLFELAKKYKAQGQKVGLITNDQANNLVDTTFLETENDVVRELSGSCFCCNFAGFEEALDYVHQKNNGGIIVAEPVGSCTDLSATIMQPLKEKYSDKHDLKALSVLADPYRLKEVIKKHDTPADYIVYKQFEEADVIVINKIDLLTEEELTKLLAAVNEEFPKKKVFAISVKENKGIDEWLEYISNSELVEKTIVAVDYDVYAAGEAAFGWLNASFELADHSDYKTVGKKFIGALGERFDELKANIGHVKFLLQDKEKTIIGNLTGRSNTITLRTENKGSDKVLLTVNARVEMGPDELEKIVLEEVEKLFANYDVKQVDLKCLIPGYPNPTHRYKEVVK